MLDFNIHYFLKAQTSLAAAEQMIARSAPVDRNSYTSMENEGPFIQFLDEASEQCIHMQLLLSVEQIGRMKDRLREHITYVDLKAMVGELKNRMADELKGRVYLSITDPEASLYRERFPFGVEVTNGIPLAGSDITEAAKCLALERPTATVFHLMRVMERSLHLLAKKLGVKIPPDKTWQTMLNQLNGAVTAMPEKTVQQKARKEKYASVLAHLFNVKLAWRNPVMHPKATYTLEEAGEIFGYVKNFTRYLVSELL